jgi:hypothetical protein
VSCESISAMSCLARSSARESDRFEPNTCATKHGA